MSQSESVKQATALDLSGLPPEAAKVAEPFFKRVLEDAGDTLVSITVVGSAATPDFRPGLSDVNSVLVLDRVGLPLLEALADLGRKFGKRGIQAPLLMTPEYIDRSLDVFPLEFLEFKLAHLIVYGRDFFEDLAITKEHVRLACERELKGLLIKARRGYLTSLNNTARLKSLLFEMANSSLPVLRGLLFLEDKSTPVTRSALLEAAETLEVPLEPLKEILAMRTEDRVPPFNQLQETFKDFYDAIETASHKADRA